MSQHDPDYQSRRFVLTVVLMITMGVMVIALIAMMLVPTLLHIMRGGFSP